MINTHSRLLVELGRLNLSISSGLVLPCWSAWIMNYKAFWSSSETKYEMISIWPINLENRPVHFWISWGLNEVPCFIHICCLFDKLEPQVLWRIATKIIPRRMGNSTNFSSSPYVCPFLNKESIQGIWCWVLVLEPYPWSFSHHGHSCQETASLSEQHLLHGFSLIGWVAKWLIAPFFSKLLVKGVVKVYFEISREGTNAL